MTREGRTFRVFVSSTFKDLVDERNALAARVFPKLRELAARHGCRFQAIDLRWGVPADAGLDHRAMRICLDELARCQKVSPRPNFLILLGDRYGWRPPPAEIPADEFERLRGRVADKTDLDAWYKRDENAVPPVYVLQPRTGRHEADKEWEPVEQRLRRALLAAAEAEGLPELARVKYEASATEQEIRAGALAVKDAHEHVFAFFREIEGLAGEPYGEPDEEARRRQEILKAGLWDWLRGDEGRNVARYKAKWTGQGITTDHLDALCKDVEARLSEVIEREAARLEKVEPVEAEAKAHEAFGKERARVFIGRAQFLERIDAYVRAADRHPLALWGESGCGKSALMAKAVERVREAHPGAVVVERFIGATAESSDIRSLLESICQEVSRAYGDATPVPQDFRELASEFPKRLGLAKVERRLIVFLDALDQLSAADNARSLAWLPGELPEHVRLVVSTLPEECLRALEGKLAESQRVKLASMDPKEGRQLLACWLSEAKRKLTDEQERDILAKFGRCRLPLYLRLAFDEARRWRSYDGLPKGADEVPGLNADVPGVLEDLFARLTEPRNHGPLLVSRALGLLSAAKSGLTEDELLDVLSSDDDLMKPLEARWELPEKRLPVALWSRLYADLEAYLTQRAADGTSVMSFYHRQVGEAAAKAYLSGEDRRARHAALARYFGSQDLWREVEGKRAPNVRKVSEQPYQETHAGLAKELERTLTDLDFIEAKCTAGRAYELVGDYARVGAGRAQPGPPIRTAWVHERQYGVSCTFCLAWSEVAKARLGSKVACPGCGRLLKLNPFTIAARWSPGPPLRPIAPGEGSVAASLPPEGMEIAEFVRGQAHVLAARPGLTLQQAANEPEGTALARTARARLDAGNARRPWVEWINKPKQRSPRHTTLTGHSDGVAACSYSPDGRFIVSGSRDRTLKLWDAETGAQVATLAGHSRGVTACAYFPDGRRIVSASWDKTLKVWDAETGTVVATLAGHSGPVASCACSLDGRWIISGSLDNTLRVWDAKTGLETRTLTGHSAPVLSCAFSPDGTLLVSASSDYTVRLWDARSGVTLWIQRSHSGAITTCAFDPRGRRVVSGAEDEQLVFWDLDRRTTRIRRKEGSVLACVFSPDGTRIASGHENKVLRIWDADSRRLLATLHGHAARVTACAFSPDGKKVVTASDDVSLKMWEIRTHAATHGGSWRTRLRKRVWSFLLGREGTGERFLQEHEDSVLACEWSSSEKLAVSAAADGTLTLWDTGEGRRIRCLVDQLMNWCGSLTNEEMWARIRPERGIERTLSMFWWRAHRSSIVACAFSPDNRRVVSASRDGKLKIWDLRAFGSIVTLTAPSEVSACAWSPDGMHLVSGSIGGTLNLWAPRCVRTRPSPISRVWMYAYLWWTGQRKVRLGSARGHSNQVTACAYAPDGRQVVSASLDKTLKIWDAERWAEVTTLAGHSGGVCACAWSPDGRRVVSASNDKTLKVWDAQTGAVATLAGHSDGVQACAYSADGKRLVSGSRDKTVKVWDAEAQAVLVEFCCDGAVTALALSPDQTRVLVGSQSGMIAFLRLHGIEPGPPIITPWHHPADDSHAFGCPACRRWSGIPPSALGTEFPCPRCGLRVKLNPFTIDADWRPIAEAWAG